MHTTKRWVAILSIKRGFAVSFAEHRSKEDGGRGRVGGGFLQEEGGGCMLQLLRLLEEMNQVAKQISRTWCLLTR